MTQQPPVWGQPGAPAAPVCYRHPDRATYISCARCGRPICPECMTSAAVGFQCPECVREGRSSVRQRLTPFGGKVIETAYVTYALIAVNALFFIATIADNGQSTIGTGGDSPLYEKFALFTTGGRFDHPDGTITQINGVAGGDYYRLLTSMFMHAGILHIAVNMFALYQLGPALERILGWWRFLAVYMIAGLGGSVATYVFSDAGGTVGASGAIFGLFAVLFLVARRAQQNTNQILVTIGINLVLTFSISFISKTGHVGGLITGLAAGAIVIYAPWSGPRRTALQVGGLLAISLIGVIATVARTSSLGG